MANTGERSGTTNRERVLSLRGDYATLAALAFMAESWAGEVACLVGIFLLGMSLGCLYYLWKFEEGR